MGDKMPRISNEALAQFSCWGSFDKTHATLSSIARELLEYRTDKRYVALVDAAKALHRETAGATDCVFDPRPAFVLAHERLGMALENIKATNNDKD